MTAKEVYEIWINHPGLDPMLKAQLEEIRGNEKEIEERFYTELEFGTAGLRGILGAVQQPSKWAWLPWVYGVSAIEVHKA